MVAPLIGAQLLHFMSWRGLFGVVTAISLALLAVVALALPETLPTEKRSARGMRTILSAMATLSRDHGFMGFALIGAVTSMAFFAYITGSSFVFQDTCGVSATAFGLLFGLNAIGLLIGSSLNDRLLGRFGPRTLLGAGLVATAVAGAGTLVALTASGVGIWAVVVPLFVLIASFGMAWPDSTALALTRHPESAGSASAYYGMLRLGLGALATPLIGLSGQVSALSLGLGIAIPSLVALPLFVVVARRTRDETGRDRRDAGSASGGPVTPAGDAVRPSWSGTAPHRRGR